MKGHSMAADKIVTTCEYCGRKGIHGEGIEIRNGKVVCVDIRACDDNFWGDVSELDDSEDR